MSFETFRGRNVAEAVAAVKAAFGPNAVIASTRHVSNGRSGGLQHAYVEVTAAPGGDLRPSPFSRDALGEAPRPRALTPAPRPLGARLTPVAISPTSAPKSDSALEEIRALRAMIEEMRGAKAPPAAAGKAPSRALQMLQNAGIEGALAAELAAGAPRTRGHDHELRTFLRERVTSLVSAIPSPIAQPGRRLVACVGPTGAGKTTTLAKLAAEALNEHGRTVAIVTLDTFRVGAVEQTRRFAELLDVTLHVATTAAEFADALAQEPADLVLVDTPSRAPSDRGTMGLLAECLSTVDGRAIDVLLVVPASIRARDAEALESVYETCPPTALVVTKLDETTQAGGALHAAIRGPLPLAYLAAGPRVPEDLSVATPADFAAAILPER